MKTDAELDGDLAIELIEAGLGLDNAAQEAVRLIREIIRREIAKAKEEHELTIHCVKLPLVGNQSELSVTIAHARNGIVTECVYTPYIGRKVSDLPT